MQNAGTFSTYTQVNSVRFNGYFNVSKYATRLSRSFAGTSIGGIALPEAGEVTAFLSSDAFLLLPTPASAELVLPTPATE